MFSLLSISHKLRSVILDPESCTQAYNLDPVFLFSRQVGAKSCLSQVVPQIESNGPGPGGREMDAAPSLHPSDQILCSYGLGKLDDSSASAVSLHLEQCPECRQRVGAISSDSFLSRLQAARPAAQTQSLVNASLLEGTLGFTPARAASATPPSADTLPPGLADHLDYKIKRELGRGGMGVVYLAHNLLMGRDEVLKVMGREIMEKRGVLERFQREIRAVAKLRHENIVTAYTAFRIEGGLVFAMEYVEGLDLARLVKVKGPLSVPHAAYFAHQTALGLQHAHEKGTVHRDIKPHNLMLTHDGKARLIKILDFGLAKATREQTVDSSLTREGQALGTPDYIAPEQILNATDVDIRADLYSLGGTLYFLLTGRPPFSATSLYDIYQAHISRDADPLNLIRPEVPAELAALVAKLLAKEPRRRFQTPAEVAEALKPFFKKGHTPLSTNPPPSRNPPPRQTRAPSPRLRPQLHHPRLRPPSRPEPPNPIASTGKAWSPFPMMRNCHSGPLKTPLSRGLRPTGSPESRSLWLPAGCSCSAYSPSSRSASSASRPPTAPSSLKASPITPSSRSTANPSPPSRSRKPPTANPISPSPPPNTASASSHQTAMRSSAAISPSRTATRKLSTSGKKWMTPTRQHHPKR